MDLSTVANWLQILQSIPIAFAAIKWGKRMFAEGTPTTIVVVLWLLTAVGLVIVGAATLADRAGYLPHRGMVSVADKHFVRETVVVDDHAFFNCTFEDVTFRYAGGRYSFDPDSKIFGNTTVLIANAQASSAIEFLRSSGFILVKPQASVQLRPAE